MRNFINILNEAWANTVKAWERDVDVYENPSRAEWVKLFKQYPGGLRGHILATGELIVWDAMYATHSDLTKHYKSVMSGYRYFYPDHILFNDLQMELNEDADVPRYDWYVTKTYVTTINNDSVRAFYGDSPKIIGADYDLSPSQFPITAEWIEQNCVPL